jgi:uncharacterized protein YidB (DUF937 family)
MDLIEVILGAAIGTAGVTVVKDFLEKHGGLSGVVAEFEKTGFGQQVKSWVSTEPNVPISGKQVEEAVGPERLKEVAEKSGVPYDKVLELLAQHLPTVVDKATPEGKLPSQ